MKSYRQKIMDIIKADIITMNGSKNSMTTTLVMSIIMTIVSGFCINPAAGTMGCFMIGGLIVPTMFNSEMKNHGERLYGIIPVERKELVTSRFIFCTAVFFIAEIVIYLMMLISLKTQLYNRIFENGELDFLKIVSDMTENRMSPTGFFNLVYFASYSFGLKMMAWSLRSYLSDSKKYAQQIMEATMGNSKMSKKDVITGVFVLAILVVFILLLLGVIKITAAIAVVVTLLFQLAQAANGLFLGLIFIIEALFLLIYCYISALLTYEEKDI